MFVFLPYFAPSLCPSFFFPDCISLSVEAEKNRALRRSRRIVASESVASISCPHARKHTHIVTYACPCPILTCHYRRNPSVNTALNTQRNRHINIPPFVVTHKKKKGVDRMHVSHTHRRHVSTHTHSAEGNIADR